MNKWASVSCSLSWALFPLLGYLSSIDLMGFALSYSLFCQVWLLVPKSLFFSNEIQKGRGSEGEER